MKTLIAFLLIPFAVFSQTTGIAFFEGSWSELLQKAQTENKPVFVDCYTTWCGPCKWMAKNVFPNDTVGSFYNAQFINYKIDMEQGEGLDLATRYEVKAYPTLLYVDASGKAMHKVIGRLNTEEFISEGKAALDPSQQLESMNRVYENGERGSDFIRSYAARLSKSDNRKKAGEVVNDYLASLPEQQLMTKENWELISQYVREYENSIYKYVMNHKAAFDEAHPDEVNEFLYGGALRSILAAGEQKDEGRLPPLLDVIKQTSLPEIAAQNVLSAKRQFHEAAGQWDEYAELSVEFVEKEYYILKFSPTPAMDEMLKEQNKTYEQFGQENSANALNNICWTFYEHIDDKDLLNKAVEWIDLSVKLNEAYYNLDTYAALLFKAGREKDGSAMAEKAIAKAKATGVDYKSTEELVGKYKQ